MAFRTSRTFTVRGRPPRLAGGISEPTSAHSASVKSLSYLRPRRSAAARCSGFHMRHLSPTQVPHKESQPIRPTQLLSGSALSEPAILVSQVAINKAERVIQELVAKAGVARSGKLVDRFLRPYQVPVSPGAYIKYVHESFDIDCKPQLSVRRDWF